ncbi:MAG: DUF72 domain-containing protein [Syntrophaceae bacterium]|nr:DUF72 domain-containing protein [Syntrophaceae bacterium]
MIKVGCCGFPVRREIYYQTFRVVEVQQTFYKLPRISTARAWREEAPPDFEFTMKAWQLITHEPSSPTYRRLGTEIPEKKRKDYGFFKGTEEVEAAWARTAEFATALSAKKILFQSPASFYPSEEHIRNLKQFFKRIGNLPFTYIWEPRGQWERPEVEKICTSLGIIPCLDPFGGTSVRGDLLYARLHGRTGYRYRYSEEEMKELIRTGEKYPNAYLMFNHVHMYEDGRRLKELLEQEG